MHGLPTGVVALIGVCFLLVTGVERWRDSINNSEAWDALVWLGGLLAMARSLKEKGVVDWFAKTVQEWVSGFDGLVVVLVLAVIYFYSMYGFSMLTGHIAALIGAFFAVALASGALALLTVALLAYFSNLCGCLTELLFRAGRHLLWVRVCSGLDMVSSWPDCLIFPPGNLAWRRVDLVENIGLVVGARTGQLESSVQKRLAVLKKH